MFNLTDNLNWLDTLPKRASSATLQLENEQGQILIVKASYKRYWTFPGGVIDPGETPKEAAVRETLEEVGITVLPDEVSFVSVANRFSHHAETYQFVFKAPLSQEQIDGIVLQASEISDYALVDREEVASRNRLYGQVIHNWAQGVDGYIEQVEKNVGLQ